MRNEAARGIWAKLAPQAELCGVLGQWNGRDDLEKDKDEIERKYTPTTSDDEIGYVDLVVKVRGGAATRRDRRDIAQLAKIRIPLTPPLLPACWLHSARP